MFIPSVPLQIIDFSGQSVLNKGLVYRYIYWHMSLWFLRRYIQTCTNRVRTYPCKLGKYCNLIIRIPGLDYIGISSKIMENLDYEPIFGAVFYHVYNCDAP